MPNCIAWDTLFRRATRFYSFIYNVTTGFLTTNFVEKTHHNNPIQEKKLA